jgi:hypothetical protein
MTTPPGSRDNFRALVDPETVLRLVAIVETAERLHDIEEMRTLIRRLAAYVAAVPDDQATPRRWTGNRSSCRQGSFWM